MRTQASIAGACLAIGAGILIAGCGDDGGSELASLAPPDAPLYAEFAVRPEGDQVEAIESFAERVGGIDDPGARIVELIDSGLAADEFDANYEDDIEPWLGERAAVFVRSFGGPPDASMDADAGVLLQTTDVEATRDFIDAALAADPEAEVEELNYDGVDYSLEDGETAVGVVDETLVLGTESAFKVAVDASAGQSLAESEEFDQRTEALEDDLLGMVFFEPAAAIEGAIAAEDVAAADARAFLPLLGGPLSQPVAAGLSATEEAATIEIAALLGEGDTVTDAEQLESLPAGSWFAAAAPDVGPALGRALDQLSNGGLPGANSLERELRAQTGIDLRADLSGWVGDVAAFVEGTGFPGVTAGIVAETDDPQAPRALLVRVQRAVERETGLRSAAPPSGADYGFSLGIPGVGGGGEAGVVGDRVAFVIGGTLDEALEPAATLADDERFQEAAELLGDDYPPGLFVHLPSFFELAERGGSASDPSYVAAKPYLEAFEVLAGGSRVSDGLAVSRLTLSLVSE